MHRLRALVARYAPHRRRLSSQPPTTTQAPPVQPPAPARAAAAPHVPATGIEDTLCGDAPLLFDTHKLIGYLRAGGFSQMQSESLTMAMARVSQHASRHQTGQMVSKSEFSSLRSELSILEKADFALLKTEISSVEKRLETSVAEIYTAVERVENRVIKWVIAVAGAITVGILRITGGLGGSSGGGGGNGTGNGAATGTGGGGGDGPPPYAAANAGDDGAYAVDGRPVRQVGVSGELERAAKKRGLQVLVT